jgi:hypothetical protein
LPSLAAARQIVNASLEITAVEPCDMAEWQSQSERFSKLIQTAAK